MNGKAVVRFNNSNVLASASFSRPEASRGVTVLAVCTGDQSGAAGERLCGIGEAGGAAGQYLAIDVSNSRSSADAGSGARFNNGKSPVSAQNPPNSGFHVTVLKIGQSDYYQDVCYYVNDPVLQVFDSTVNPANRINFPETGYTLTLGTSGINGILGTSDMYSGDMAEIMVFKRLLFIEKMKALQNYLYDKYFYSLIEASPESLSLEEGQTGDIAIRLNAAPTEDVILTLEDSAESDQLLISPPSILFTGSNWDAVVSVQVTAQDNGWFEGLHLTDIKISAQSADPQYQRISTKALVTIIDNECSTVNSPPEDLNFDCIAEISDIALLAESWLWCDPMRNVLCHDLR